MKEETAQNIPGRNDPCVCGSGRKFKKCCGANQGPAANIAQPMAARARPGIRPKQKQRGMMGSQNPRRANLIKTPEQIAGIRQAGKLASALLDMVGEKIRPGITTNDIDTWVEEFTQKNGAISATLGYKGYTKSVCTSVNEVICHGIPSERRLEEGDIINVDVTPILNGYYGDSSRMFPVGKVSAEADKLMRVARECMDLGIAQVRPGGNVGDIGHAIQSHAEAEGFSVVREFVGHGTGVNFHEDPQIPHFGKRGNGPPLLTGMVFTVEPMINQGHWRAKVLDDDWTAVTIDGKLSAQWEHTLTVTDDGVEILTC